MKKLNHLNSLVLILIMLFLILLSTETSSILADMPTSSQNLDIQNRFVASGYMGDGEYGDEYIKFEGANESDPHSPPTCIKIKYIFGPQKYAGIYWQNKPDNWGDRAGTDYSRKGFTKVTFYAKGETGKEVVEFKSGGIHDPQKSYHDSYEESTGRITLTQEWEKYEINLEGVDLSSVIGGFCWVASKDYNNQNSITFFVDNIQFE